MMETLEKKVVVFFPGVSTKDKKQWFRWVEYYTYYNAPVSAASMYNYLVISGFMRSIAMLMLIGVWAEIAHLFIAFATGWKIHTENGILGWASYFFGYTVAYVCALTAYVKFYRRYVEEAIMGFVLEVPFQVPGPAPRSPSN